VHWFNQTRLHGSIGHVPPIAYETEYYRQITARQQPLPGELALH
jgi:transposase InsO family protein